MGFVVQIVLKVVQVSRFVSQLNLEAILSPIILGTVHR